MTIKPKTSEKIASLGALADLANYSLLESLTCDPDATEHGEDYQPRQVFSGHYVPVKPTPIENPVYISHSKTLFDELNLSDELAQDDAFMRLFTGDMSELPESLNPLGWATGYALSIYGNEYYQQCPFHTGNGYGDGRAISVLETVIDDKRWEMQLKGGGPTPYCRGADGRAVLRSSVREFLAQEYMHALGIPTSRSLTLYASTTETVHRPWYLEGSMSEDPEIMVSNPVAISTRVAPSFLRVGQLELFARRARKQPNPETIGELTQIVNHLISREYASSIDRNLPMTEQVLALASQFRERLFSLVTQWIRVGFCQGNFNSDNCAAGGFTLDYGPFGFCERFDPLFQPWTGGGRHFSFLHQPFAAQKNYQSFCSVLKPLLAHESQAIEHLDSLHDNFMQDIEKVMENVWAAKLGLANYQSDIFVTLVNLMVKTPVDYTIFFRELSHLPTSVSAISKSFYNTQDDELMAEWQAWLTLWHSKLPKNIEPQLLSDQMKAINPKYTWREWLVVPAYQAAAQGDYRLVHELQIVFSQPYDEQSKEIEAKYYRLRPEQFTRAGGVSHYSCSS